MKLNTGPQPHTSSSKTTKQAMASLPRDGSEVLTDEALIFHFLRGFGEAWSEWVSNFLAVSNVGGFGTGTRLGWGEVTRAVLRAEQQSKGVGAVGS